MIRRVDAFGAGDVTPITAVALAASGNVSWPKGIFGTGCLCGVGKMIGPESVPLRRRSQVTGLTMGAASLSLRQMV